MKYVYKTKGTCSQLIELELEGNIVHNVKFTGGCNGNLSGMAKLLIGQNALEVADKLEGTTCGNKMTSCPDQLSKAMKENIK